MRGKVIVAMVVCALAATAAWAAGEGKDAEPAANPVVLMKTSMGDIKIELWADKAPETVKNFLGYVEDKFYNGTIFHRVIPGFMSQGGGFTADMKLKQTKAPIKNEAKTEVSNALGTIAMARTREVNSATSQFFINAKDNAGLDHKDATDRGFGYCVFGKVIDGMDVVEKINNVDTDVVKGMKDVPVTPVVIESVTLVK